MPNITPYNATGRSTGGRCHRDHRRLQNDWISHQQEQKYAMMLSTNNLIHLFPCEMTENQHLCIALYCTVVFLAPQAAHMVGTHRWASPLIR